MKRYLKIIENKTIMRSKCISVVFSFKKKKIIWSTELYNEKVVSGFEIMSRRSCWIPLSLSSGEKVKDINKVVFNVIYANLLLPVWWMIKVGSASIQKLFFNWIKNGFFFLLKGIWNGRCCFSLSAKYSKPSPHWGVFSFSPLPLFSASGVIFCSQNVFFAPLTPLAICG